MSNSSNFIKYKGENYPEEDMISRSKQFFEWLNRRRSVREFSNNPIPKVVIENIIKSASTAPSGAHKQPWTFCAVSDPEIKKQIREAAEKEEYENYNGRMSERWLQDLTPFGTNHIKPFLEIAPWLIIVFKHSYEMHGEEKKTNYYVTESVGIACGILLTAIHNAGLVSLTHTPSPMGFLSHVLKRPENEKPYLLIPVGYAENQAKVPNIKRKSMKDIARFY